MNHPALTDALASFPAMLRASVADLCSDDARRKPPTGAWSITEIVAHLADEESLDFRTRVRLTLEDPSQPWPPIDPEGRATEQRYNDRDLLKEVGRFEAERAESLVWLRSLDAPDWSRAHDHPRFGPIAAGDLLVSWAAHDMLHLRQIAKRRFELVGSRAPEFSTRYAGEWGP